MDDAAQRVSACLIIIGNEILSGRTVDANLPYIAQKLGAIGIRMAEVRVVADDDAAIVEAVNACRARYDYVFTTGGIGPTHDDITAASIAKAFGLRYARHPEAERRLLAYYPPERVNAARMKMADMPEGAELIDNPVSVAPGFRIANVYVLPGVPKIMQAMLDGLLPTLEGGAKVLSRAITVYAPEGDVANAGLGDIQARFPAVEVGSYPFFRPEGPGTTIVFRGTDQSQIGQAADDLLSLAATIGAQTREDLPADEARDIAEP
ncbi:MAG TPA: competence/damage-inducible protein A [Geminicoccaceae bacterium]|nr:competence/damage-inducible protein A [Geminicoccaceae bacterium]